jgi:DNA-binding NarL/FixJ family response regulator
MVRVIEMNNPLRLLLVDGHRGVRQALCARLAHMSQVADIVACDNLTAALGLMHEFVPDAVLCDPRTVGGQESDTVRQLAGAGCPVVVLTASLQDGEADDLNRAGAAVVLLKGCMMTHLLATLEAVAAANHAGRYGSEAQASQMTRH